MVCGRSSKEEIVSSFLFPSLWCWGLNLVPVLCPQATPQPSSSFYSSKKAYPLLVHGLLRLSSPEEVCQPGAVRLCAWSVLTVFWAPCCVVEATCVAFCCFRLYAQTDAFPSIDSRLLSGCPSHHFSHSSSVHTLLAFQKDFYRLITFHWWDYTVFISSLLFFFLFIWFYSLLPSGSTATL